MRVRYDAGTERSQDHAVFLNLNRAGIDEVKSILLTRFIEFWCQKNCRGLWRVEVSDTSLAVSFEKDRDAVLFKISSEYGYFEERWQADHRLTMATCYLM